jgi:hypothetical protein
VALLAGDHERAVERAAPADLDGVADRGGIARLAEDAMVEALAALGRPLQELDRAVDGDALLVAGDQERDRAFRSAGARRQVIEAGGHRTGDRALHVDGAAAVEDVAGDVAAERRVAPGCRIAGRHHVGMARKADMRFFAANARK